MTNTAPAITLVDSVVHGSFSASTRELQEVHRLSTRHQVETVRVVVTHTNFDNMSRCHAAVYALRSGWVELASAPVVDWWEPRMETTELQEIARSLVERAALILFV